MVFAKLGRLLQGLLFLTGAAQAQFYAPDTEYHDPVQRVYVVEAARVLGWLAGLHGTDISEVRYQMTTKPDQTVTWSIEWLGPGGKSEKTATVSYTVAELKSGPVFYRSVLKQLWKAGWEGLTPLEATEARERFWKGAARMGPSRERSLSAALALVPKTKGTDSRWQPELAGLLAHAALPGTAYALTLDRVTAARSAAWLALVEQACATTLDDLWPPVLFEAGRVQAAAELWGKTHPSNLSDGTVQQQGWNVWLRQPTTKDIYLFATERGRLFMAMPMLAYDVAVNQTGPLLAELLPEWAPSPNELAVLHNYAPVLALRCSISGGHIMDGAWPVVARADWLKLLGEYQVSPTDYAGYTNVMQSVRRALAAKRAVSSEDEKSSIGLRETSPLLTLARKEGTGKLTPTAVATSRDLLNYGWEAAGLQMGARHCFVAHRWGIPDEGEKIFKSATDEVEGWVPFFKSSTEVKVYNYQESLKRLQMVGGLYDLTAFTDKAVDLKTSIPEPAKLFVRRCWLRPQEFDLQGRSLLDANAKDDFMDLVESLRKESGAYGLVAILRTLDDLDEPTLANVPRGSELKFELAENLPEPTALSVRCVYEKKLAGLNHFEQAQAVERVFWKNPDSGLEDRVFRNYMLGGGYKSARRFYRQIRENIIDTVRFSNGMGLNVFVAAYLLGDTEMRKMALEDSNSGSYSDMIMNMWDSAIRDDTKALEQQTQELIERYESEEGASSRGRRLAKFLPLLPALRDPNDSSRNDALRFFGKDDAWLILRWVWVEKFVLKPADAITFLGGREAGILQHVLTCYLDADAPAMLDALNKFNAQTDAVNERSLLVNFLYFKLKGDAGKVEETDLKPPDAAFVRSLVLQKIKNSPVQGRPGRSKSLNPK